MLKNFKKSLPLYITLFFHYMHSNVKCITKPDYTFQIKQMHNLNHSWPLSPNKKNKNK